MQDIIWRSYLPKPSSIEMCWWPDSRGHRQLMARSRHRAKEFAYRNLWNVCLAPDHSGLMLAARTTLAQCSVSSAINLEKAAGGKGSGDVPNSASRARILGSESPALISL